MKKKVSITTVPQSQGDLKIVKRGPNFEQTGDLFLSERGPIVEQWITPDLDMNCFLKFGLRVI